MNRKNHSATWPEPETEHLQAARRLAGELAEPGRPKDSDLSPDALAHLLAALDLDVIGAPGPDATARLAAEVGGAMKIRRAEPSGGLIPALTAALAAVRPQIGLFRPPFWVLTAFVFLLGAVASGASDRAFPVSAATALAGVLGIAYAMRSAAGRALEIEMSCPIDPVSLVAARSLIVLLYDLILTLGLLAAGRSDALGSSLGLDGASGAVLLRLIAPLVFFTALTLLTTVHLGPAPGLGLSLTIWGATLVVGRLQPALDVFLTGKWSVELGLLLLGGAIAGLAVTGRTRLSSLAVGSGGAGGSGKAGGSGEAGAARSGEGWP